MPGERAPLGVVADTNLYVSATILRRGAPYALLSAWRSGTIRFVTSPQQIDELRAALRRPRIRKYGVTDNDIDILVRLLTNHAEIVEPDIPVAPAIRDPFDAHILGLAMSDQVDYLVTGDNDLLVLDGDPQVGKLKIVTVRAFLDVLLRRDGEQHGSA